MKNNEFSVGLGGSLSSQLSAHARAQGMSLDDAASKAVTEGLDRMMRSLLPPAQSSSSDNVVLFSRKRP